MRTKKNGKHKWNLWLTWLTFPEEAKKEALWKSLISKSEPKSPFQEKVVIKSNVGKENKTRLEENIF